MPNEITVTNLNIRQSISILLVKLIIIDFFLGTIVVGFYFLLVQAVSVGQFLLENTLLFVVTFAVIGTIKIVLGIYIILKWLNEYYEITPYYIIHKKGVIFQKVEQYKLENVRAMDIQDSLIGELFNFATITLYDIRMNKYLDLYLIHNPERYARVIQALRPDIEVKKEHTRLPFLIDNSNGVIKSITT